MKKWYNLYVCIVTLLALSNSSCALSKRPQDNDTIQDTGQTSAMNEKRDATLPPKTFLDTLNRGKEISLSEKDFKPILPESTNVADEKDGKEPNKDGFRIQCFASSQIERVRSEQKLLESKVKYPIYVVFNTPYYKLFLGDFIKRSDADNALIKIKEMGYPTAWITRSRINPPGVKN